MVLVVRTGDGRYNLSNVVAVDRSDDHSADAGFADSLDDGIHDELVQGLGQEQGTVPGDYHPQ